MGKFFSGNEFKLNDLFFGIIFLSLGISMVFICKDIELKCTRVTEIQNQCNVVSYGLLQSQTIKQFSNVEGAILEQQVYEPISEKKSIVNSRITIVANGKKIPLGDDYMSRFDQQVVQGVNSFTQDKSSQLVRLPVSKSLYLAYIGVILILGSLVLIKKSI